MEGDGAEIRSSHGSRELDGLAAAGGGFLLFSLSLKFSAIFSNFDGILLVLGIIFFTVRVCLFQVKRKR